MVIFKGVDLAGGKNNRLKFKLEKLALIFQPAVVRLNLEYLLEKAQT
jgi:hypothetical protein